MHMALRLVVVAALACGAATVFTPAQIQAQSQPQNQAQNQAQAAEREPEEPTVFPDGENRDEVFYICTTCHGSALVRAQGHSRERWSGVLDFMVERHGMPEPSKEDRDMMLDYLAKAFPPKGRGYSNPFLKQ